MNQKDMGLLVEILKSPLMMLVKQRLITEEQADERARNQAMGLFAYFELSRNDER